MVLIRQSDLKHKYKLWCVQVKALPKNLMTSWVTLLVSSDKIPATVSSKLSQIQKSLTCWCKGEIHFAGFASESWPGQWETHRSLQLGQRSPHWSIWQANWWRWRPQRKSPKKKKMKHDKSIDVNKTNMLLFVFAPPPTLPDLLVSHLCEALAGQSVSLYVS